MDVGFRHPADRRLEDPDLDLGMIKLRQFLHNRLDRATDIRPDDEIERRGLLGAETVEEVLERDMHRSARETAVATDAAPLEGHLAGHGDRGHHLEAVAGTGSDVETADEHRLGGPGRSDPLLPEGVVHRLDGAASLTADERITDPQRPLLHDEAGGDTAPLVDRGIEAHPRRCTGRIDPEIIELRDRQKHVEEMIDPLARQGTRLDDLGLATPLGGKKVAGGELLVDALDVDPGEIDLIDADDNRHAGRLGMADRFLGLRHDAVVSGDDEDGAIGDIGPAGPHLREGLVAGGVDEGDRLVVVLDCVGTDVLSDATALAGGDIHPQDPVEEGGLPVIDMAEERHDRRAGLAEGRILVDGIEAGEELLLEILNRFQIELDAELGGEEFDGVTIEHRAHARHRSHPERQQFLQDVTRRQADRLGKRAHRAGDLNGSIGLPRRSGRNRDSLAVSRGPTAATTAIVIVTAPANEPPPADLLRIAAGRLLGSTGPLGRRASGTDTRLHQRRHRRRTGPTTPSCTDRTGRTPRTRTPLSGLPLLMLPHVVG